MTSPFCGFIIFLFMLITGASRFSPGNYQYQVSSANDCELPIRWIGKWISTDFMVATEFDPILIDSNSFEIYGQCVYMSVNKQNFKLVFNKREEDGSDCFRGLSLNEHQENVLGYYVTRDCCDDVKSALPDPNDPYHYLYRYDVLPVPCPFRDGTYQFSYHNGGKKCNDPISKIYHCALPSKILFSFQSCPDVNFSSKDEILTCIGSWKGGSDKYLVGKVLNKKFNEENYRCLKISQDKTSSTYEVSISGTPSCTELNHSNGGHHVLSLSKAVNDSKNFKCELPSWLLSGNISDHWDSLNGFTQLKVINETGILEFQYTDPDLEEEEVISQFQCTNVELVAEHYIFIIGTKITDCDRISICLRIYHHSHFVIEVQEFEYSEDEKCTEIKESYKTNIKNNIFIKKSDIGIGKNAPSELIHEYEPCPMIGKYSVNRIIQNNSLIWKCDDQLFNTLMIGCPEYEKPLCTKKDNYSIQFFSSCPNASQPIAKLQCLASWESKDLTYVIVQQINYENIQSSNEIQSHHDENENGIPVIQNLCILIKNSMKLAESIEVISSSTGCNNNFRNFSNDETSIFFNASRINEPGQSLGSSGTCSLKTNFSPLILAAGCFIMEFIIAFVNLKVS